MRGPFVETFWRLIYGRHLTCEYLEMMPFCSKTWKIKYFLDPPPKKRIRDTCKWSRYGYTLKCLSIPAARDLDILLSRDSVIRLQSNPFIENYNLIIVVFLRPHFSIYDILYTKENTRSFNARASHFKHYSQDYCGYTKLSVIRQYLVWTSKGAKNSKTFCRINTSAEIKKKKTLWKLWHIMRC